MTEILIEKLSEDSLNSTYFKDLFVKASKLYASELFKSNGEVDELSEKELSHLLRFADILSNSLNSKARNKAYQIISILNYKYNHNPIYKTYSMAVFAKLGNFPAIKYLIEKDDNLAKLPYERKLQEYVKKIIQAVPSSEGFVFTDTQYQLYTELINSKSFSFSGPTSMGKSFIIRSFIKKIIRNKPPENLVIMVPTRALINQFVLDLMSDLKETLDEFNYKIITNSNVTEFSENISNNYIFILTPERLISYLSQEKNPSLGFIFVDEAHKIAAEKDVRSVTAYNAIEKTLKIFPNINLYFASPNVSNPEVFLNLFEKETKKAFYTIESPVSQNLFFVNLLDKSLSHYISGKPYDSPLSTELKNTNDIIKHLGNNVNNIIYCNSTDKTINKSFEFYHELKNEIETSETNEEEIKKAIKKIKSYIHKDYYLATFLESGIAYHYGYLPQIIRNIVEDLFRNEYIKYMFCTSTLLEGINMPAKNVFIVVNKKGQSNFTPIDFWNLAGRAGRLNIELSGDIFCIKENENDWKNTDILESKGEIELKPTVLSQIERNLIKIESIILDKNISGTQTEKEILRYISNIICIDTMEIDTEYKSPIIKQLIENNKIQIIEYAQEKTIDINVPLTILKSNQSIDLKIQNKVYNIITKDSAEFKLPNKINYEICLNILYELYDLYEWNHTDNKLKYKKSLKYYALLMNKWINGSSLSQIINESIDYNHLNNDSFYINHKNVGKFNKENKEHINVLINNIIKDIETILRFSLEKYFNHYYLILVEQLGEEDSGANFAQFLEYGTQNKLIIALQNLGVSRHSANYIFKKHRNCLNIENNKLKSINREKLFSQLSKGSIESDEIMSIL